MSIKIKGNKKDGYTLTLTDKNKFKWDQSFTLQELEDIYKEIKKKLKL